MTSGHNKHNPKHAISNEQVGQHRSRLRQHVGRIATSAIAPFAAMVPAAESGLSVAQTTVVAALPAADFFGAFDAGVVKTYSETRQHIRTDSETLNSVIDYGTAGAAAFGISLGLGLAISRTKRLKGAFKLMEEANEEKRAQRSKQRQFAYTVLSSPFIGLRKVGDLATKAGEKVSTRKSKIAREVGYTVIDAGQILAITSTGVVGQETFSDNPPSDRRNARLAALGSGVLLGLVGAGSAIHDIPFVAVQAPMNAVARSFDVLTTVKFPEVWSTPVGAAAMSLAAFGLLYKGHEIATYQPEQPLGDNSLVD